MSLQLSLGLGPGDENPQEFPIEGGQVVRLSARNQVSIKNHFFIHPVRTCILQIIPNRDIARQATASEQIRRNEKPTSMTDDGQGFVGRHRFAHEAFCSIVDPELVGVQRAARQYDRIIVAGIDLIESPIHGHLDSFFVVSKTLKEAHLGRKDVNFGTRLLQDAQGFRQFSLLKTVGRQKCDAISSE